MARGLALVARGTLTSARQSVSVGVVADRYSTTDPHRNIHKRVQNDF